MTATLYFRESSEQQVAPTTSFTSSTSTGGEEPKNQKKFNPLILLIPLVFLVALWQWPSSASSPVISHPIVAEELYVMEAVKLGKIYQELGKKPSFIAAFDGDDLDKLNRVMNDPGALLNDLALLQWALNALNRFHGEIADSIRSRICEAVPRLCGASTHVPYQEIINLDTPLQQLNIKYRVYVALYLKGIKTINELLRFSKKEVMSWKKVGKATLKDIEDFLEIHGIEWH